MTVLEMRRPSVSRKSIAGQLLFIVVLLLTLRFLWLRKQPERLMKGPALNAKISGENVFLFANPSLSDMPPSMLQVQSIHQDSRRLIDKEDTHFQFYHPESYIAADVFAVAEGKLYYAVEPRPNPFKSLPKGVSSAVNNGPVLSQGEFLGNFLSHPKGPTGAGIVRKKLFGFPPTFSSQKYIGFRQVNTQGGTPQDVMTFHCDTLCLVGNHVFWIRPGPEETVEVIQEQGRQRRYWHEVIAQSDLMLTSLTDGTTRCLRHGVPRYTRMTAGESGISWTEPAPFPEKPAIFYACVADGSVRSLGTLANNNQSPSPVVEAKNRLYWTDYTQYKSSIRVLSANADGTDIREVCAQRDKHAIVNILLHEYRGSLYCGLTELPTIIKNDPIRNQYLCRLYPERSDPLEVVYKLPKNCREFHFDGGYFYFIRSEPKRSLWAALTNDDAGMEYTNSFYRVAVDR